MDTDRHESASSGEATTRDCVERVSSATLSALRDNALSAAETERLRAHVTGCAACQHQLATYDAVADALRGQRELEPGDRVVEGLRGRVAHAPHSLYVMRHATGHRWRSLSALASVAALLLLFAYVLGRGSWPGRGVTTAIATSTPLPAHPLRWTSVGHLPIPSTGRLDALQVAFAPGDGETAYACGLTGSGQGATAAIWVSHDRGGTWRAMAPFAAPAGTSKCFMQVDSLQPSTAAVNLNWSPYAASPSPAQTSSYLTTDGGATWRLLTSRDGSQVVVNELATYHGVTYATLDVTTPTAGGASFHSLVVASDDQLRTARRIDAGIFATLPADTNDPTLWSLWVNPATGSIFVQGGAGFWTSSDAGARWTRIPLAPGTSRQAADTYVFERPFSAQPWQVCDLRVDVSGNAAVPYALFCTTDAGRTWSSRPALLLHEQSVKGASLAAVVANAIATDSAVIAAAADASGLSLYRLPPDNQWQSLGPLPDRNMVGDVSYVPTQGGGFFWYLRRDGTLSTAAYPPAS